MVRTAAVAAAVVVLLGGGVPAASSGDLVIEGGVVYPVSSPPIPDGAVLVRDGRIVWVGPAAELPDVGDPERIEAAAVTPGLVDPHSVVGLAGVYNSWEGQVQDQDQLETSDPVQPELRAVDAYDPREPLVAHVRSLGVTTLHTGHGPGAVISGQTMIVKTRGESVAEAVVEPLAMVAATLGSGISAEFETPRTRPKAAAMLRAALVAADDYRARRASDRPGDRDLGLEVLARVLDGEVPLLVTAQRAADIATALRLQRELGFRLVLDGAAEAPLVLDEIRAAGVPVVLHPTMARPGGETRSAAFTTAAELSRSDLELAIQTGYEGYVPKTRVLLYEAQVAYAHGLDRDAALAAVTLAPARILGVGDRVGSLEPGKDADLVLFDGDPLEYTSRVCTVLIEGEVVSDRCH